MSHISKISGVQLKSLGALQRALTIANQQRNLTLELQIGVGLTIRGWAGVRQNTQYIAIIRCPDLNADVGLSFVPDIGQAPDAVPVIENQLLQNGHFVLEADLMMLYPLGLNLNLITNLYTATLIQAALGSQEQMDLLEDNSIVLAN